MGRNTTTPSPQSLDRFSIGEIVDIQGVPDYYDAGTSKWLKSNTFTPSSNLPEATKTNIANSSTGASQIALASTLDDSFTNAFPYTLGEIPRISASSISCFACSTTTTSQQVLVVKSTGVQLVTTGLVTNATGSSTGATALVVSDNSKFYHYGYTSSTTLGLYTSTDGTTWTSQAMTGLPTFSFDNNGKVFQTGTSATRFPTGDATRQVNSGGYSTWGVVWCGARFVFFGYVGSYFVAYTSTNGYTWADNTSAVLGTTTAAKLNSVVFYRNGNNCFLKIGATAATVFTADGGVTWAGITRSSNFDSMDTGNTNTRLYRNTTDPAKLLMSNSATVGNTATISTDSGAYFNTDITLPPFSSTYSSIAWKGSTMLFTDFANTVSLKISTNNGVTFTNVLLPAGTLNSSGQVYADATRFYFFPASSGQVLISTDGVTWTVVSLPSTEGGFSTYYGTGIAYFDTNKVIVADYQGYMALTTDGGVTWKIMSQSANNSGQGGYLGNLRVTPDGGGFACSGYGVTNATTRVFSGSSVTAGGSFYKVSAAAIAPLRTDAKSYVRIA